MNAWTWPFDRRYKHLPHFNQKNLYQFITYRTYDSIDGFVRKLQADDLPNDKKQLAMDQYLDRSRKGALLTGPALTEYCTESSGKGTGISMNWWPIASCPIMFTC